MERWTLTSLEEAIEAHLEVRYAAEERVAEIDRQIAALRDERERQERLAEQHRAAGLRLVSVRRKAA